MKQFESLFWGVVAALGAFVIEFVILMAVGVYYDPYGKMTAALYLATPYGIVGAALIEESFKYLVIIKRIEYLSLVRSYVVNSLLTGFGFFLVEAVFIYMKNSGFPQSLLPLGEVMVLHMVTAAYIGYSIAVKNPNKLRTVITTVLFATCIHSAFNLIQNTNSPFAPYMIFFLLGVLILMTATNFLRISRKLAG